MASSRNIEICTICGRVKDDNGNWQYNHPLEDMATRQIICQDCQFLWMVRRKEDSQRVISCEKRDIALPRA